MNENIERLKREIEELERQIAAHPFESLFDRKRSDQLYHKLKKKRKELAEAENVLAGGSPELPFGEPEDHEVAAMTIPDLHEEDFLSVPPVIPPKTEPYTAPIAKVAPGIAKTKVVAPKKVAVADKAKSAAKTKSAAGSRSKPPAKAKAKPAKAKPAKPKPKPKNKPAGKSAGKSGKKKSR